MMKLKIQSRPTLMALTRCFPLILLLTFCPALLAQKNNRKTASKPTVLIVATYHMGNPNLDVLNVAADDVLNPNRQREIKEFVGLLKKFKPTKITLEYNPARAAAIDERYARYVDGRYELVRNEIDQLGFRLAKELGHRRVYGIDAAGRFDIGKVFAAAAANNQQTLVDRARATGERQVAAANRLQQTATITEIYRAENDPRTLAEAHQAYLLMARVGRGEEYAGAELLGDWYARNLKIYSNLARLVESNEDRLLVIIGAHHVKLLQQFVEDSGEFRLERTNRYF